MSQVSTTATLNGRKVTTGDTIISFRGDTFTFDYIYGGKVYTKERAHAFNLQVFPDNPPEHVRRVASLGGWRHE